jgi:hypothetical protein
MQKMLLTTCVLICLFSFGCTTPLQKVAIESSKRGLEQTNTIVYDLATEAKQSAIDTGRSQIIAAVASHDEAAAIAALETAFNKCNRISWLQIEYEKAKSYVRLSQQYIWSQQGFFDLMLKEFSAAKTSVEQSNSQE